MRPTHLAVQRLMADGFGFGGEGDWKTSVVLRAAKVMVSGLPGGTSFMEEYTYHLVPGEEKILGAHMLEVCPSITSQTPSLEIHPLGIGGREDPVRLRSPPTPVPRWSSASLRHGGPVPVNRQRGRRRGARRGPASAAGGMRGMEAPALAGHVRRGLADGGAPHHTVLSKALDTEVMADFAEMTRTEMVVIDADTTPRGFQRELRWNAAYHRLAEKL